MALVRVLRGGQVTLPAALRRKLKLAEGDYLEAEVIESGLLLKRVSDVERERAWDELMQIIDEPKRRDHHDAGGRGGLDRGGDQGGSHGRACQESSLIPPYWSALS